MFNSISMRTAAAADLEALVALMPQLADFEVPPNRNPDHLWQGDLALLNKVLTTQITDSFVEVAVDDRDAPVGLIIVTMRPDFLSHAPSAHLEAITVHPDARGLGIGRQLLTHAEQCAKRRGAQSLSLNVFSSNKRALALYDSHGYDSELIRAIKWL